MPIGERSFKGIGDDLLDEDVYDAFVEYEDTVANIPGSLYFGVHPLDWEVWYKVFAAGHNWACEKSTR